jgi:hypothetical protein
MSNEEIRNRTRNAEHNKEEHNTHTHQWYLHMDQQQAKAAISSLDIFLTPDDGHVG